jgi:23S rRNA (guanosine2251-2'-O)-methyltransferase
MAVRKAGRFRSAPRDLPRKPKRPPHPSAQLAEERREPIIPLNELLVGRQAVREALRARRALNRIWIQEGAEGGQGSLKEIVALAQAQAVPMARVPRRRLDQLAMQLAHQGVVAQVSPVAALPWEELWEQLQSQEEAFLLLLDRVQDPQNLGAILRVADGAGAAGVVVPERGSAGLTAAVAKASAGAVAWVPVARVTNLVAVIERLQQAGYFVFAATQDGERLYYDVDWRGKVALVVGSEGKGVRPLVRARCDQTVRIPMAGKLQSLNAATAAAVVAFEALRQRRQGQ